MRRVEGDALTLGGAAKFHDGVPMGVEHLGVQYRCICGTARVQRQFLVDVRKAAGGYRPAGM